MSETTNLGLYKHDNPATNEEQFNIDKALNQNWGKVDTAIGNDRERINLLEASNTIYNYKGKVDTLANLQLKTKTQGDVWYCEENSTYYACNGTDWIPTNLNLKLGVIDELKEKTIKCLQEVETPTPVSGTRIDLTDSAEAKIGELKISGNSVQETRSGKNKLDTKNNLVDSITKNGINFTNNGDGTFNVSGTVTETTFNQGIMNNLIDVIKKNTSYYFYCSQAYNTVTFNLCIRVTYEDGTYQNLIANKVSKTEDSEISSVIMPLWVAVGTTIDTATNVKMMIVENEETDNEFEEYGASPSPDYLSEVESCGDNGNINVEICNKNFETTISDYIEHQLQTYTIPTQQPMRAVENVRDTFILKNNKWYERHWIKRVIFDGTETWNKSTSTTNVSFWGNLTSKMSDIDLNTIAPSNSSANTIVPKANCNYFKVFSLKDFYANKIGFTIDKQSEAIEFRLGFSLDAEITTVVLLKAKLQEWNEAGTPLYVDYVLETPLDIECTEEQSTVLWDIYYNAKTYDKITHIYSTDNVEPNIEVTYKKDIATLFENTLIEEVG